MQHNDTLTRRTLWTSGKDQVEAMNRVGRDKPYCDSARSAHQYMEDGESLFRITTEEFPLDEAALVEFYLEHIEAET